MHDGAFDQIIKPDFQVEYQPLAAFIACTEQGNFLPTPLEGTLAVKFPYVGQGCKEISFQPPALASVTAETYQRCGW